MNNPPTCSNCGRVGVAGEPFFCCNYIEYPRGSWQNPCGSMQEAEKLAEGGRTVFVAVKPGSTGCGPQIEGGGSGRPYD